MNKLIILNEFPNIRTIKHSCFALSFSVISLGNCFHIFSKHLLSLSSDFTYCFINPHLICKGEKMIFFFRKGRCYSETIFITFIMYNGLRAINWDVFSWSFFPTVKTKALKVLGFLL